MNWLITLLPDALIHSVVLFSIIGLFLLPLLSFIHFLKLHKTLITYVLIGLLAVGVYLEGAISNENKWKREVAELNLKYSQLETKASEKTVEIVEKVVEKVVYKKGKTVEIIKEIPKYITVKDDAQCVIPNSFVQLHDFAAKGEISGTTSVPDGGTSDFKLSEVSDTVFSNYGTCHEIREKYIGLQFWVREQKKIADE